ncbi:hypothetical protein UFOVP891_26 [uncultured Caudovirales phage]|uniref:Uncharacterized protein n=1 Tax=uncultured Caudovirales phage TaxID=2100421 RepID=A0A6J5T4W6_9CAUD|nr:hypothetical protein UFOVP472_42 [uncultured Caudovirales phage]CAB4169050.1 hypothetical protein UFOVP891_26 [uncultured Caudovirales phage]CAB4180782.1 hypothetical protein UFOVP1053_42 [uncultured Caudovirales phage]CAB4195731.1 hypothetical protein UFOVP1297_32 [uncultured Caudovirales phage]CAB4221874.1 hypothetical protein UFOVP1647_10 [uncultured Caudovirales phage]
MKLDWQRVVLDLRTAGFTCAAISRKLEIEKSFVQRLANGASTEPRFSEGLRLLDLHHDLCGKKHTIDELRL